MKLFPFLTIIASVVGHVHAEPLPRSAETEIFAYIQNLETIVDGLDVISDGMISEPGFLLTLESDATFEASWWELFGELLTAHEVLKELEDEDYLGALGTANTFYLKKVISKTAFGKGAVQASSVASIGLLAVELYLDGFVNMMDRQGVERQLELYKRARGLGMTHNQIMRQDTSSGVHFGRDGWISQIVTQDTASVARAPTSRIGRDEIFEFFGAAFDARERRTHLERLAKRRFIEFRREVKDKLSHGALKETPNGRPLEGSWSGYSTAGASRVDYKWTIKHRSPSKVEGTISLKWPSAPEWKTYNFEGELERGELRFRGTSWVTKDNSSFCMVEGRLTLFEDAGSMALRGSWGPHDIPGGCPRGSGGRTDISKVIE